MGTWVMGIPAEPSAHPVNQQAATWVAEEAVPSNTTTTQHHLQHSGPPPAVTGTVTYHQNMPQGNPYVVTTPATGSTGKRPMDKIADVLNKCGKKLEENTRKVEGFAGNLWQHLKIGPSLTDTAMGRIAQGTKLLTEGGYESVFRRTFETIPGEKFQKAYACYLSTSAGPVIGTLYLSTVKLAFCSDSPLAYYPYPGHTEWSYYKVTVLLSELKAVNPSANRMNPAEKYIQIITTDDHEFWFMGFVTYGKALENLQKAFETSKHPTS